MLSIDFVPHHGWLAVAPRDEEILAHVVIVGFVQLEADEVEDDDYERAVELRDRAVKLYFRAKNYGTRGLDVRHKGFSGELALSGDKALGRLSADDVPLLYWTGLSWTAAIALSLDDPQLVSDLAIAEAMMERALELDPDWDFGSIRSFFITYEMGRMTGTGDPMENATRHYMKALELSGGLMASVYVAYAEAVSVENQDKEQFVSLLNKALAIDLDARPEWRLSNRIYQRRAKWLLTRLDWLFL